MERLQKVIAKAGIASRRKAEELIREGRVAVNGTVVREMGIQVSETDEITVNGQPLPLRSQSSRRIPLTQFIF